MLLIEMLDSAPEENIVTCLSNIPDSVVYIGEKTAIQKNKKILKSFLKSHCSDKLKVDFCTIARHDLNSVVEALTKVVKDNDDICIDLTGGDDLSHVATGIVYAQFPDKRIQLHRYNMLTGNVYDCDMDGDVPSKNNSVLSVEDIVELHGGKIVTDDQKSEGMYSWELSQDFINDVRNMWKINVKNINSWNSQISVLGKYLLSIEKFDDSNSLHVSINDFFDGTFNYNNSIFEALQYIGVIKNLNISGNRLRFDFKNYQIRKVLEKAGTILEVMILINARAIKDSADNDYYNDVQMGVYIDWDGDIHDEEDGVVDTDNEMDIVMMKGLVPIFVSCKNGSVDIEELYKLNTVADRFGGKYVRKVLIRTKKFSSSRYDTYFVQRAKDMGIRIIDGVRFMTEDDLQSELMSIF